jgi:GntR family transcriptional regulator, trigonelline degradation regulator
MDMDQTDLRVNVATESIRRKTFESLFNAILNGYFKSGERLVERELCELTGVSRSSVREALRQLESEGLVEIVPNRGPIVATMDAASAQDIYELREAIEGKAASLFIERASEAELVGLQKALTRSIEAAMRRDLQEMLDASTEFSQLLFEGCGNTMFAVLYRNLKARLSFLRIATAHRQSDQDLEGVVQRLEAIRDAIRRRDGAAMTAASVERIRHAATLAIARISADEASQGDTRGGHRQEQYRKDRAT